jgi:antibiotic biosynthesis monooxygenase (ABM) superfamily enzyme
MDQQPDIYKPARTRRLRAQVTMTLTAWAIAFLVVMAVFTVFDDEFESIPRPLRALVLSGVLVALMVNLVMPAISAGLSRRLPAPPVTDRRPGPANRRGDSHEHARPEKRFR